MKSEDYQGMYSKPCSMLENPGLQRRSWIFEKDSDLKHQTPQKNDVRDWKRKEFPAVRFHVNPSQNFDQSSHERCSSVRQASEWVRQRVL